MIRPGSDSTPRTNAPSASGLESVLDPEEDCLPTHCFEVCSAVTGGSVAAEEPSGAPGDPVRSGEASSGSIEHPINPDIINPREIVRAATLPGPEGSAVGAFLGLIIFASRQAPILSISGLPCYTLLVSDSKTPFRRVVGGYGTVVHCTPHGPYRYIHS